MWKYVEGNIIHSRSFSRNPSPQLLPNAIDLPVLAHLFEQLLEAIIVLDVIVKGIKSTNERALQFICVSRRRGCLF